MPISREYQQYLEAELSKEKRSVYEIIANQIGKKIPFEFPIDKDTESKMKQQLAFIEYKTTPQAILKSAAVIGLIGILIGISGFLITNSGLVLLIGLVGGGGLGYYFYVYLSHSVRFFRIRATSDLLLSILYMVISLRITPNLENALLFAAVNVTGPVGRDLKKTVWDMSLGKYESADEALEKFASKWKEENEEFSEAVDIIRTSSFKSEDERNRLYEEAINVILERNTDRMKNYTQQLTNPVAVINYIGITLPVLTVILFPILTIFLTQQIRPILLVLLYNVALPIIVYWLMMDTLRSRPLSFGVVDISSHPKAHKIGTYKWRGKVIKLWPISLAIAAAFILLGYYLITSSAEEVSLQKIMGGLSIVWGIAGAMIFYSYFSYRGNTKIKEEVIQTENEFTEALFELGLILNTGYSVETSVEKLLKKIKNLKISSMFQMALENIERLGYTFEKAIFDPINGVIRYYPSIMIRNIMRIFVESLRKGSKTTAMAMMSVAGYLKSVYRVEQFLKEMLSETTSEMQFMLSLLVPVATGIIVGLAALLTLVLVQIAQLFSTLTGVSQQLPFSSTSLLGVLVDVKKIVPVEWFAVIVGVYMIEVIFTLAIFISSLQHGEDPLEKHKLLANGLFRGMLVFTIVSSIVFLLFRGVVAFLG